jgi:hypothetical protein
MLIGKERHWIQVPHYSDFMAHTSPTFVKRQSPIQPQHIASSIAHQLQ